MQRKPERLFVPLTTPRSEGTRIPDPRTNFYSAHNLYFSILIIITQKEKTRNRSDSLCALRPREKPGGETEIQNDNYPWKGSVKYPI